MAFGVIRALHEAGRIVPDDVSVVSVDDIALATAILSHIAIRVSADRPSH